MPTNRKMRKRNNGKKKYQKKRKSKATAARIGKFVPDVAIGSAPYAIPAALVFNVAAQVQTILYTMNDAFTFVNGGGSKTVGYLENYAANYTRYLVRRVKFSGKFINNDLTANTSGFLLVMPVEGSGSTVPTNQTTFAEALTGKYTRSVSFSLPAANKDSFVLRKSWNCSKLYGKEYLTNETYASVAASSTSIVGTSPTTVLYFVLAVNPAANFTVTTGGLYSSIIIQKTVKLYGPDTNDSLLVDVTHDAENFLGLEMTDKMALHRASARLNVVVFPQVSAVVESLPKRYSRLSYSNRVYLVELAAQEIADKYARDFVGVRAEILAKLDKRVMSLDEVWCSGPFISLDSDVLVLVGDKFESVRSFVALSPPSSSVLFPLSSSAVVPFSPKFCVHCGATLRECSCV